MAINTVTISGNLTRDAELKSTKDGTHVLSFSVAVNDRVKNQQTGEWEDRPNYVDCTLWGERGAKIAQYMTKGARVSVEGKLRYHAWEQDGAKRSKLDVNVREVVFMSSANGGNGQQVSHPAQTNQARQQGADGDFYDSDIPF